MKLFSPVTKALVAAALMSSSTVTMAQNSSCQGTNCVLPLPAAPAPLPPVEAAVPVEAAAPALAAEAAGFSLLPVLIAGLAAALAIYFIVDDEDEGEPVSP